MIGYQKPNLKKPRFLSKLKKPKAKSIFGPGFQLGGDVVKKTVKRK